VMVMDAILEPEFTDLGWWFVEIDGKTW
jgi:hypothetical protein